jgi:hypothetical protein
MTTSDEGAGQPARKMRADAQRNEQALLAAAAVFVTSGVEAPVRDSSRDSSYLSVSEHQRGGEKDSFSPLNSEIDAIHVGVIHQEKHDLHRSVCGRAMV